MSESKEKARARTESIYLQYAGQEAALDEIRAAVQADYDAVKQGSDAPKTVKIYLKPEDGKAYYVINDDCAGEVPLPLA